MNTLLIKQPISELILEMRRSIEDRNLNFNFHSEFLLHSSNNIMKEMVDRFEFDKNYLINGVIDRKAEIPHFKVYNILEMFNFDKQLLKVPKKVPDYDYRLGDVKKFDKPINLKDKLNFFEVNL